MKGKVPALFEKKGKEGAKEGGKADKKADAKMAGKKPPMKFGRK